MEDNKKLSGHPGKSGCVTHLDFQGYGKSIKWDETYPEWLISIIKHRNENLYKEWIASMEHEVRSEWEGEEMPPELANEHRRKVREMSERVDRRFKELERIYGELDKAIDEAVKYCVK